MKRLTAAELREPDVIIECTEDEFYKLPEEARNLIRAYGTELGSVRGHFHISVAAYRWREEIAPLIPAALSPSSSSGG